MGALALLATALLGPGLGDRRVREIEDHLVASIEAHDDHGFDTLLVRAVELHPNEPSFAVLRAHVAIERHDRDAARWLNRSIVLAPGWVAPHLLAARWLILEGALSQAWLEIREAEAVYEGSGRELACALVGRSDGVDEAMRLFASRPTVLDRLASCPGLPSPLAARIDESLLTSHLTLPRVRIAWRANATGDYASAIAVLEPVAAGRDPMIVLTLAQTYERAGRPLDAIALLGTDALEPELGGDGYRTLARAYADVGDAANTRSTIDRLRGLAHGSAGGIAAALLLLGALEHRMGNDGHALRAFEQAARLDPASEGLTEVARISEQLGDRGRAYRAWAEVCRMDGPSSEACTSAQRLRGGT